MKYERITGLPIEDKLTRSNDELDIFVKEYSENHFEIKLIVNGYKLTSENGKETILNSFSLTKVFPFENDDKFVIAKKKIDILTTLLTYTFNGPKNHSIRFSAGNGTLFPLTREYNFENYMTNFMIKKIDANADWQSKKEKFLRYVDFFIDNEKDALPFFWYGKGLLSNDSTSAFLNFYRCIEVLSKYHLTEVNSQVRDLIEKNLNFEKKAFEIQKIYGSVSIPRKFQLPLFLEEHGIKKQTYNKWREFRNKLAHGDSLEFNNEFTHELANLHDNAKILLDAKIVELFPEHHS